MKRHRNIISSPVRSPAATWEAICELVVDTLDQSASIGRDAVETVMATARPAGLALVAGGHLDREPLTLVADPVHCNISTVNGSAAFNVEENLRPLPGGASATGFVVYLPAPDPHENLVRQVTRKSKHLCDEAPPESAIEATSSKGAGLLDSAALTRLRDGT